MILDKGICTVFRRVDAAVPGSMPAWEYSRIYQSWYGEIQFETSPANPTDDRTELRTDARIRVLQHRDLRQRDVVILRPLADWSRRLDTDRIYTIDRAYHGQDDDGPTPITDLTLREVRP